MLKKTVLLLLFALLFPLFPGCRDTAGIQTPPPVAATDPMGVRIGRLTNGITVYLSPNPELPQVVAAEMAYERLHSATDVRFGTPQKGTSPVTPDDVARMLRTCTQIAPKSPFPYAAASSYYLALGPFSFSEGLSLLDEAIARAPKRAGYYYRKYQLLKHIPDRSADAAQALKKAQTLSPKNPYYAEESL